MDKLRVVRLAFVCGLLSTPAFPQLTTIGPNTPGVSEFEVTLMLKGTCLPPGTPCLFPNEFTPILPLQPGGGGIDLINLGPCLTGCAPIFPIPPNAPPSVYEMVGVWSQFDVSFHTPVQTVVALQMYLVNDLGGQMLAFDGQQIVASCRALNVNGIPPSCFHVTQVLPLNDVIGNITLSAPQITSVWIGGAFGGATNATAVQFGVPEPGTFGLFALALAGLGITGRRRVRGLVTLSRGVIDPLTVAAQTGTSLVMIEKAYLRFIPSAMQEKLAVLKA